MVLLSRDFGVTYDERFQQKYGEELWEYVHGQRPRASFDTDFGHQNLYGGTFELAAVAVQHALPWMNLYVVRHGVNAVFGWLAIVFCWLIGRKLFGEWTGLLAASLLILMPRFLGHSMNNPKDIPFAAFAAAATYFLVTLRPRAPIMTWPHAVKLGIAIGLAVSVRPVGLLFLGYLAVIVAWFAVADRALSRRAGAQIVARTLAIAGIVIAVGVSTWPWAQRDPLRRPIQAFVDISRFPYGAGVLFNGEYIAAEALPRSYIPTWLWLSVPAVVILGAGLSLLRFRKGADRWPVAALWVFILFPILAAIARHSTLYDGLRHLLFVLPLLAVLSSAGWSALVVASAKPAVRWTGMALLAVGLVEPFVFIVRNHPDESVYFSPNSGGPRAAFGRYDMDYWGNCTLEAVRWSRDQARAAGIPVALSGRPDHLVMLDAERYGSVYFTSASLGQHHLSIHVMRGPRDALLEFAARNDIVHRVQMADGTPLCLVVRGPLYPQLEDHLERSRR